MPINLSAMLLSSKEELGVVDIVCGQCDRRPKKRTIISIYGLAGGLLVAAAGPVGDTRCPRVACKPITAAGDWEERVFW